MKSYQKIDCVGVLIRRNGKKQRFFKFKTKQVRGAVTARLEYWQKRFNVTFCYGQTERGAIF